MGTQFTQLNWNFEGKYDMEKINVKVLEEYRGHMDPERKYHLVDIETGREPIGNLKRRNRKLCQYISSDAGRKPADGGTGRKKRQPAGQTCGKERGSCTKT